MGALALAVKPLIERSDLPDVLGNLDWRRNRKIGLLESSSKVKDSNNDDSELNHRAILHKQGDHNS